MKNESKALGGIARALQLSPEERTEIAQKAALARWKNHQKIEKEPPKRIKGIANNKFLMANIAISTQGLNMAELEIVENGEVIRLFNGQTLEQAHAKIEGYVSALEDLGISVEIQINNVANMEL
jgi:hypothetical protein